MKTRSVVGWSLVDGRFRATGSRIEFTPEGGQFALQPVEGFPQVEDDPVLFGHMTLKGLITGLQAGGSILFIHDREE